MPKRLSEAERRGFHEAGYCAPISVMSAAEAQHYRAELERFEQRWPDERHMLDQGASLLCPWIDEFTRHPGLLDPMEDLLGPNLLVWGVSLRLKEADGRTFAGWHQDTAYCDIKPIVVIAALALSDCGEDAGCLRVIPGSHRGALLPHRENFGTDSLLTREQQIDAPLDKSAAVSLPMAAGEAVLFNNAICHSSAPNRGDDRRIVFLIEYVPTHAWQHEPRESAMLVRGVDRFRNFDVDPRPAQEMSPAARAAWRRKVEVQAEVLYRGAAHPTRALASGSRTA
ncbi:MAG: phytanoyl-CoA dioxygenase family protein [Rhodospirillales bacterium]|nr:phytanoyl-CoA dioxygenase family protein [Rhodospirillales bacterium]